MDINVPYDRGIGYTQHVLYVACFKGFRYSIGKRGDVTTERCFAGYAAIAAHSRI